MKKALFSFAVAAVAFSMAACGNKSVHNAESAVKRELNEVISHALPDEVNRLRWAGVLRNIPIVSDILQWADNFGMLRRLFGKSKEE